MSGRDRVQESLAGKAGAAGARTGAPGEVARNAAAGGGGIQRGKGVRGTCRGKRWECLVGDAA